jgi:hypothetical protein
VEHGRIEICSAWPYECAGFGVESYGVELGQVAKWAEQWSMKNRLEIDDLSSAVGEGHRKAVWSHNLELRDAVDRVDHKPYLSGSILTGD